MWNILLVMLGGAVGSLGRYGLGLMSGQWVSALPEAWQKWPLGTFVANVLGGLLMGVLMGMIWGPLKGAPEAERARLLLGVGGLGGFTTFSTFSLEAVTMMERRAYGMAAVYVLASVSLSVLALMAGLMAVRKVMA